MIKHLKRLPLAVMIIAPIIYIRYFRDLPLETIGLYQQNHIVAAAFFLIALYGVKSFIIVFPIAALYAAGGVLFPLPFSIIVNIGGTLVCLILPYTIGRLSGPGFMVKLVEKYPKLRMLQTFQNENTFFFCYMARIMILLPCDGVSLYMGACKLNVAMFLAGSLLGMLPGIVAITFLGVGITKPGSPEFMGAFLFIFFLTIVSLAGYKYYSTIKSKAEHRRNKTYPSNQH